METLISHLRNRLLMRSCSRLSPREVKEVAGAAAAGNSHAAWQAAPLVDHGPPVPPAPAVNFFVYTNGVQ